MATLGGDPDQREKQRLCPSCRMSISALATRCHYCGEEVARPKVEDRKLTINDLGGLAENKFQLSGSVLDALEAFRAEEGVSETPKPEKKSLFGKRSTDSNPPGIEKPAQQQQPSGTSLLDELGLAPKPVKSVEQGRDPAWTTKVGVLGGFVAAIVILFFGGVKGFAMISDYLEQRRAGEEVVVVNRAPELLRAGDLIGALEAAVEANKLKPDEENQDILAQIRKMVADQVRNSLDSPNWRRDDLSAASSLAHRAAAIDPSNRILGEFLKEIEEENEAYSFVLMGVDSDGKSAQFKRGGREVEVGEHERLYDRFDVVSIRRDAVILLDSKRDTASGKRRLHVGLGNVIRLTNE